MSSAGRPPPVTIEMFGRAYDGQTPSAEDQARVYECFQFWAKNVPITATEKSQRTLSGKPPPQRMTLEKAFGISGPSGTDPIPVRFFRARSNEALRKFGAVAAHFARSMTEKTHIVCRAIDQYREIWKRPRRFDDPAVDWLLAAFRWADLAGADLPDGEGRIRQILTEQDADVIDKKLLVKTGT